MCLNPIHIRNRSKYFNRNTLHKTAFDVPCGQCAECLAAKRNEYYFRSYYQALDCWEHGGYCLFDTLTYNNENVPHINDYITDPDLRFDESENFTCFDYRDIRYFFVRLRRYLSYHGFSPEKNLKYFLCSEYGEDPRYTHRPHYHVMFYVYDNSIDPIMLSKAVDKCWQKGITDGAPYQGSSYVLNKRVFWKGADELHMRSVCNYIGKYMTKDSEFSKTVKDRMEKLLRRLIYKENELIYTRNSFRQDHFPIDLFDTKAYDLVFDYDKFEDSLRLRASIDLSEKNKAYIRELSRHVNQFIRQSQGFGAYCIEKLGKDFIYETGCLEMPDQEQVVKRIPVPQYIVNKMFKEKAYDPLTGEVYLRWSDYGNSYREYHAEKGLESMEKKFVDTFNPSNLSEYFTDFQVNEIRSLLQRYLQGSTVRDLLYYQKFLKGRLWMSDDDPDFESFYYCDQRSMFDETSISRDQFFDPQLMKFHDACVIHDDYYDYALSLYSHIAREIGKVKQKVYDEKHEQELRYKKFGMKIKNN